MEHRGMSVSIIANRIPIDCLQDQPGMPSLQSQQPVMTNPKGFLISREL